MLLDNTFKKNYTKATNLQEYIQSYRGWREQACESKLFQKSFLPYVSILTLYIIWCVE